jgi:hypothetical protein
LPISVCPPEGPRSRLTENLRAPTSGVPRQETRPQSRSITWSWDGRAVRSFTKREHSAIIGQYQPKELSLRAGRGADSPTVFDAEEVGKSERLCHVHETELVVRPSIAQDRVALAPRGINGCRGADLSLISSRVPTPSTCSDDDRQHHRCRTQRADANRNHPDPENTTFRPKRGSGHDRASVLLLPDEPDTESRQRRRGRVIRWEHGRAPPNAGPTAETGEIRTRSERMRDQGAARGRRRGRVTASCSGTL